MEDEKKDNVGVWVENRKIKGGRDVGPYTKEELEAYEDALVNVEMV
jgi:hypothetical protein